MSHAVSTIRWAGEDSLACPTSGVGAGHRLRNIGFCIRPLTQDNVVYEVHAYPPKADVHLQNILVIVETAASTPRGRARFPRRANRSRLQPGTSTIQRLRARLAVDVAQTPKAFNPNDWARVAFHCSATHSSRAARRPALVSYLHGDSYLRELRMQRKSFADMECNIARSVEEVGDGWSSMIGNAAARREAFFRSSNGSARRRPP